MIAVGFILAMTLMFAFAEKLLPDTRTHSNRDVLVNLCGVAVTTPTALTRTNSASIWPDAPTRNSDPGPRARWLLRFSSSARAARHSARAGLEGNVVRHDNRC